MYFPSLFSLTAHRPKAVPHASKCSTLRPVPSSRCPIPFETARAFFSNPSQPLSTPSCISHRSRDPDPGERRVVDESRTGGQRSRSDRSPSSSSSRGTITSEISIKGGIGHSLPIRLSVLASKTVRSRLSLETLRVEQREERSPGDGLSIASSGTASSESIYSCPVGLVATTDLKRGIERDSGSHNHHQVTSRKVVEPCHFETRSCHLSTICHIIATSQSTKMTSRSWWKGDVMMAMCLRQASRAA